MGRAARKPLAERGRSAGRCYGGRTPEEREVDRRRRLVTAGLELFGTIGYARTTIQAICSRARITARNFYDHFASLEDLLAAVYEHVVARGRAAVDGGLAQQSGSPEVRARRTLSAYLRALLDDPRCARVQCVEVVGVSDALEMRRRAVIHAFAERLKRERLVLGFEDLRPAQAEVAALMFVAGVDELLIECVMASRYARPIDDLVEALIVTLGIRGRPRRSPVRRRGLTRRTKGGRQ